MFLYFGSSLTPELSQPVRHTAVFLLTHGNALSHSLVWDVCTELPSFCRSTRSTGLTDGLWPWLGTHTGFLYCMCTCMRQGYVMKAGSENKARLPFPPWLCPAVLTAKLWLGSSEAGEMRMASPLGLSL